MRFERKKNGVLLFRVYTIRVSQSASFLLFFGKKFKILELVFASRHILFELFVCVCVVVVV